MWGVDCVFACGRVFVQREQLGDVTGPHSMGSETQSLCGRGQPHEAFEGLPGQDVRIQAELGQLELERVAFGGGDVVRVDGVEQLDGAGRVLVDASLKVGAVVERGEELVQRDVLVGEEGPPARMALLMRRIFFPVIFRRIALASPT